MYIEFKYMRYNIRVYKYSKPVKIYTFTKLIKLNLIEKCIYFN